MLLQKDERFLCDPKSFYLDLPISAVMLEDFSYEGMWWLPENSEDKHRGTLKFKHNDNILLSLSGMFKNRVACRHGPEIILGRTTRKEDITLFKNIEANYELVSGWEELGNEELGSSTFICTQIFVGKHFCNQDEIAFRSLSVGFTYLEQWFLPYDTIKTDLRDEDYMIFAKFPRHYKIEVKSLNFTLFIGHSLSPKISKNFDFNLNYRLFFQIIPEVPKNLRWYEDIIFNLKCLLTLLIGEPVYTKKIDAVIEDASDIGLKEIKIHYILSNPVIDSNISSWQFRSTFSDLIDDQNKDLFEIVVNNLFEKSELLKPVLELFSTNYYNKSTYLHIRFLTWLHAIEAFHRRVCVGKYLLNDNYKPIYNQLTEAIPKDIAPDFKDSLKSKIRYGNEFSLRTRLKMLRNREPKSWFEFIMGKDKNLIQKLVETRNYLTHYDDKSKEDILNDDEIYDVNKKLDALLSFLLLEQMQVPFKIQFKIIEDIQDYIAYKKSISKSKKL